MFSERTSVGLDVHARSVVAAAIDGVTGEVFQARLTPSHEHILSWLADLPGPVAVTYEAGPTGFGLAPGAGRGGIRCVVAAPSKLQRPSGDRVKTDARDAVHLARLLRLDEVTAVSVPSADAGGGPGPGPGSGGLPRGSDAGPAPALEAVAAPGHRVLRRPGLDRRARRVAAAAAPRRVRRPGWRSSPTTRRCWPSRLAGTGSTRRSRRWPPTASSPRSCTGWGACAGSSTLTGFALAVEIGDWHRFTGTTIGSFVGLVPTEYSSGASRGRRARSPRPATATPAGCWSRPPGTTAPVPSPAETMRDRWELASPAAGPGRCGQPAAAPAVGRVQRRAANGPWSPTSRSPASWPAGAGRWPSWTTDHPQRRFAEPRRLAAARGVTREQL